MSTKKVIIVSSLKSSSKKNKSFFSNEDKNYEYSSKNFSETKQNILLNKLRKFKDEEEFDNTKHFDNILVLKKSFNTINFFFS